MTRGACGGRGRIEQAKGGVDRSREKAKDAEGTSNEPQPSQAAGVDPIHSTNKGEGLTGGTDWRDRTGLKLFSAWLVAGRPYRYSWVGLRC